MVSHKLNDHIYSLKYNDNPINETIKYYGLFI